MVADAPVTFSIKTGCPSDSLIPSATIRASVSVGPPAASGTIIVIGREGNACEEALFGAIEAARSDTATYLSVCMTLSGSCNH
jgi:hypothetical protein